MLKLEINKELVVSTCHVTENEINSNSLVNYSSDDCNVRLVVEHAAKDLGDGYPNLKRLISLAQDLDCKWLVLDCDAYQVEGLPVFDW